MSRQKTKIPFSPLSVPCSNSLELSLFQFNEAAPPLRIFLLPPSPYTLTQVSVGEVEEGKEIKENERGEVEKEIAAEGRERERERERERGSKRQERGLQEALLAPLVTEAIFSQGDARRERKEEKAGEGEESDRKQEREIERSREREIERS